MPNDCIWSEKYTHHRRISSYVNDLRKWKKIGLSYAALSTDKI